MKKLPREKYRCEYDKTVFWMEEAIKKHSKKRHKNKNPKYTSFYENELCPFYPTKAICNCLTPTPIYEGNIPACPYLIDRPDLLIKFKILNVEPGVYEGYIEQIELLNGRVKFNYRTVDDKIFILNGPKTTAFEIMKRSVSKDLSRYSSDAESTQRVWSGFQFVYERPELMGNILNKVIGNSDLFSIEIKEGGVLGEIKVLRDPPNI